MVWLSSWQRAVCLMTFFIVWFSMTLASLITGEFVTAFFGFVGAFIGVALQAGAFLVANWLVRNRRSG